MVRRQRLGRVGIGEDWRADLFVCSGEGVDDLDVGFVVDGEETPVGAAFG